MGTTLGLVQPAIGSTAWGPAMNSNLSGIDQGTALGQINLYQPVSVSGTTTLTSSAFGKVHELSGSSAYAVTLPSAAAANVGSLIAFRGLPNSSLSTVVTITPAGTDTIDGLSSYAMLWDEFLVLLCNASGQWTRIIVKTLDKWQSFTPVIGAVTTAPTKGSVRTETCFWKRVGNEMLINFFYNQYNSAGTTGTGTYKFQVPGGFSIDTAKCPVGGFTSKTDVPLFVGSGNVIVFGGNSGPGVVFAFDSTDLGMYVSSIASSGYNPVSSTWFSLSNNPICIAFNARIPISGW